MRLSSHAARNVPRCAPASLPCATIASTPAVWSAPRLGHRRRGAHQPDAARFHLRDDLRRRNPKGEAEDRNLRIDDHLRLLLEGRKEIVGSRGRRKTEARVMRRHQLEDARGVARPGPIEATGEQVHTEGPRGERANLRDRFGNLRGRHVAGAHRAEPSRIRDRRNQRGRTRRAGHRRKNDWMLEAQG